MSFPGWGEHAEAFEELESMHGPDAFVQACSGVQLVRDRATNEAAAIFSADPDCPNRMPWFLGKLRAAGTYTSRFFDYWHSSDLMVPVVGVFAGDVDERANLPLLLVPMPLSDSTAEVLRASSGGGGLLAYIQAPGTDVVGFRFQATGQSLQAAQGKPISVEAAITKMLREP